MAWLDGKLDFHKSGGPDGTKFEPTWRLREKTPPHVVRNHAPIVSNHLPYVNFSCGIPAAG